MAKNEIRGAYAPRVHVSAPSPKCLRRSYTDGLGQQEKVRDGEDAIASTRGRVRYPEENNAQSKS